MTKYVILYKSATIDIELQQNIAQCIKVHIQLSVSLVNHRS